MRISEGKEGGEGSRIVEKLWKSSLGICGKVCVGYIPDPLAKPFFRFNGMGFLLIADFLFLVSYDVNKDGVNVAVLTFSKSAYRLGETVVGIVEVNERSSRARVMKVNSSYFISKGKV